jgi:hypothetical protein
VNEDAFAERDACGLTQEDWASLLDFGLDTTTGPALLWWALAGRSRNGVDAVNAAPFPDLLTSLAGDARALATLASSSGQEDVRALAPALHNLHRRIATAAEIAHRAKDLEEDDRRTAREALPACSSPPNSEVCARR